MQNKVKTFALNKNWTPSGLLLDNWSKIKNKKAYYKQISIYPLNSLEGVQVSYLK